MGDLTAQSIRHGERAAIDSRAWRRRGDGGHVADRAPYLVKQRLPGPNVRRDGATRRGFGGAHEIGERHYIYAIILRIGDRIIPADITAGGRVLFREEGSGDAHFVQV